MAIDKKESQMIKVSVMMPSKNVGAYMEECLQSVRGQTLQELEILCVDAFSTDGTREIIKRHMAEDGRIRLLDDDRGSTGYSFRKALEEANGEYIGIVETDDFIRADMFELLYDKAREHRLDFVKADFEAFMDIRGERFYMKIPTFYHEDRTFYNRVINQEICHGLRICDGYMWKGIYRKDFLTGNRIFMHETKGAAFQDQGFLYQTVQKAKRVMYLDETLYYYRRDNENSSVYSANMIEKMMEEYHLIEQDMEAGRLSIQGFEDVFYYEKFARYKNVLKHSAREVWREKLEAVKEEFRVPLLKGFLTKRSGYVYQDLMKLYLSPEYYMEELARELDACRDRIRSVVRMTDGKEVVIFGEGLIGMDILCAMRRFGSGTVRCFMDNDKQKWGSEKNGVRVESPERLALYQDCFFVIANEAHATRIWKQLLEGGVLPERIAVCDYVLDSYEVMSRTMEIG